MMIYVTMKVAVKQKKPDFIQAFLFERRCF